MNISQWEDVKIVVTFIFLNRVYYKTPKDIRLNYSHFFIHDFSSNLYEKAAYEPYCFLYMTYLANLLRKALMKKIKPMNKNELFQRNFKL